MSVNQAWLARAEEEGWSLDPKGALELTEGLEGGLPAFQRALLDADLKMIGKPFLPDDINRADSKKLAGPHVLQVVAAADIAQPSKFVEADRKGRILRIKMTDGKSSCVGVEYQPLPSVTTERLVPGTKVLLRNCSVRVGVLLLDLRCFEVLGGRVEALAEGWEMQQRFGVTADRADEQAAERPPAFRHFDASDAAEAARRPSDRTEVLQAAVTSAQGVAARGRGKAGERGSTRGGSRRSATSAAPGSAALVPPARGAANGASTPVAAAAVAAVQVPHPPPGMAQQGRARRGFQPYQPPSAKGTQQAAAASLEPQQQLHQSQLLAPPAMQHLQQHMVSQTQQQQQQQGPEGQPALLQSGSSGEAERPLQRTGWPPHPQQQLPAAPAATAVPAGPASEAARQRLLDKLAASDAKGGRFGRGLGPRRGRRGRFDDDADDGSMTLEEWEAQQKAGKPAPVGVTVTASQLERDEELAKELQRQLDMEDAFGPLPEQEGRHGISGAADLTASLFKFEREQPSDGYRGRGRRGGRGRGRRY